LKSPRKPSRPEKSLPIRSPRVIQSSSSENDSDHAVIELSDSSPERPIRKKKKPSNSKPFLKLPEPALRSPTSPALDSVAPLFLDEDEPQNAGGSVSALLVPCWMISQL
jgi:hypothetical protein